MVPDTPTTAEGDLAQTPFPHLAVYALDRRLTGELFFRETEEITHVVAFERGVPVKIRMGDGYARLGELLVEEGLVTADAVEGAALTGGLLGDVLVLTGCVESAALNAVLDRQFQLRMLRLFELPAETPYAYFEGSETLKDWGGEKACFDPLSLLWQGIREHGEKSAFFEGTLERLGGVSLKLHPQATIARYDLEEDALLISEILSLEPTPMTELLDVEGVSPDIVNKFVYALAICRQLDLGRGTVPVGIEQKASSLAKVRLRSQVHRVGAAVDAPGGGERSIRSVGIRGKGIIPRDEDEAHADAPSQAPAPAASEISPETRPSAADGLESEAAAKPAPPPAAEPPRATEDSPAEESSRRLVADTIRALPLEALTQLVREKIDEKEATMACDVCEVALKKLEDQGKAGTPIHSEVVALHAWARSLEAHPDLKSLTVELDDLIRDRDDSSLARYVRGLLRKRLGNEAGSTSDFRRVVELDPAHAGAKKELRVVESQTGIKRGETGFLKRLFRR